MRVKERKEHLYLRERCHKFVCVLVRAFALFLMKTIKET